MDLKQKKITLPLIHTLNKVDPVVKKKLIYIVKNQTNQPQQVAYVTAEIERTGGFDYARSAMEKYKNQAMDILNQYPESTAKQGLTKLVDYLSTRKY